MMPDLLEPEFRPAYASWKAGATPTTSGAMLKAVQPVIDSAVKSYAGNSTSPIIRSRARRMTLDAMQTYDPAQAGLKTHLMSRLKGLHRTSAQQGQIISVPEQIALDQKHLFDAENRLRDWLGRDPNDEDLSDEVGLSPKRIAYIRKASGGVAEGTLESISADGDDLYQPAVLPTDDGGGWIEFVYSSLAGSDKIIMENAFGLNGRSKLSGQQIAKKLGITPAAVSQRKARIQKILDSRDELGVL